MAPELRPKPEWKPCLPKTGLQYFPSAASAITIAGISKDGIQMPMADCDMIGIRLETGRLPNDGYLLFDEDHLAILSTGTSRRRPSSPPGAYRRQSSSRPGSFRLSPLDKSDRVSSRLLAPRIGTEKKKGSTR